MSVFRVSPRASGCAGNGSSNGGVFHDLAAGLEPGLPCKGFRLLAAYPKMVGEAKSLDDLTRFVKIIDFQDAE